MPPRISLRLPLSHSPKSQFLRPLNAITKTCSSPYHSHNHPPPPSPYPPSELTTRILSAAYPHIPTHGFTLSTLSLGATSLSLSPACTNLFPAGAYALVHYHLVRQREALAEKKGEIFEEGGLDAEEGKQIGRKVKALMWGRLMGNEGVIGRWQEALALSSTPSNLPPTLKELSLLSSDIWYLSSDTSVDTSWYTKRFSLAAIYAATELFMTTDKSEGYTETRQFMERRLEDVRTVGEGVGGLGEWVGLQAKGAVNVLRSKGVRI